MFQMAQRRAIGHTRPLPTGRIPEPEEVAVIGRRGAMTA